MALGALSTNTLCVVHTLRISKLGTRSSILHILNGDPSPKPSCNHLSLFTMSTTTSLRKKKVKLKISRCSKPLWIKDLVSLGIKLVTPSLVLKRDSRHSKTLMRLEGSNPSHVCSLGQKLNQLFSTSECPMNSKRPCFSKNYAMP